MALQQSLARRTVRLASAGSITTASIRAIRPAAALNQHLLRPQQHNSSHTQRLFSASTWRRGIMPDAEDPKPPSPEPTHHVKEPTPLPDDQYHELADAYLEQVVSKLEAVQEGREDVDVEYSQGVLSVTFPPNGSYVINKQPPNKQIWLSSPISGPKRFDWVVAGEDMGSKEGSGVGEWMYLRDGTTMTEILRQELGIAVIMDGPAAT